ncbi:Bug family tripartite tricarboxylate transporter substrate binding protein [Caldimonas tepidiphila]|uniref:Bug family tripartite tricarboxylate transporter substrate binding protein n=1 Tax=Caldimonas tepidiphila TaxID=2315841 RepID=UPI000E5AF191|nr:tripartite tricarboxylate transporter substrate binding protein [Caldimonas tepidiphila]
MSISVNRRRVAGILAAALSVSALPVLAQGSDKPLKIIVPLSAGSTVDAVARAMSNPLAKTAGQPVVIENLPGAGGITGTSQLVRSPKDGMTLGMVSNNHVVNPSLYKSIPFDSMKDVTPLTVVGTSPFVLVVHKSVPAKNLQELVALAKAKPDQIFYGSAGNGTVLHLAGELLESEAGIDLKHVPYKGTGPMMNDLLGGQVQMAFTSTTVAAPHIASGAIKAIGITTASRSKMLPDVPTFAEQGLKNYDFGGWIAAVAPTGVPPAELSKRYEQVRTALSTQEVREWLLKQDFTPMSSTQEATQQFFQNELVKHARLVKQSGATAD